jgi:hypothetical protein
MTFTIPLTEMPATGSSPMTERQPAFRARPQWMRGEIEANRQQLRKWPENWLVVHCKNGA